MLRPRPFKDAVLLGANIDDSVVYRWLTRFHGYEFEEFRPIKSQLRALPENLGSRLRISFFISKRHAGKALYKQAASTGESLIDAMDQVALETFGGGSFLYVSNNKRESKVLDGHPSTTPIPVVSHGINRYQTHTNIYFSAALNREPQHFRMLEALGLPADDVHAATAHEVLYQCVMRTALRDPDSTAKVHAIVPVERSALRLASLVGTREVAQLGSLYTPPLRPLTPTEKGQRHEARKALGELFAPRFQPSWLLNDNGWDFGAKHYLVPSADSEPLAQEATEGGNSLTCFVTLHKSPKAYRPEEFVTHKWTVHEFVSFLKGQHRAVIERKEESALFNPCVFAPPEGVDGFRQKAVFPCVFIHGARLR
jgi:hypothetical protein